MRDQEKMKRNCGNVQRSKGSQSLLTSAATRRNWWRLMLRVEPRGAVNLLVRDLSERLENNLKRRAMCAAAKEEIQ